MTNYERIEYIYLQVFYKIFNHISDKYGSVDVVNYRKEFANFANKSSHPQILFAMLDRKDYSKYIWKLLEQEFEKI